MKRISNRITKFIEWGRLTERERSKYNGYKGFVKGLNQIDTFKISEMGRMKKIREKGVSKSINYRLMVIKRNKGKVEERMIEYYTMPAEERAKTTLFRFIDKKEKIQVTKADIYKKIVKMEKKLSKNLKKDGKN